MSTPQKRKSESPPPNENEQPKKARLSPPKAGKDEAHPEAPSNRHIAPDSLINSTAALAYWSSTEPTVNGVLGGYPQVSRVDLQGSKNFLAKLRRQSKHFPPSKGKLRRAVDCGAGIGRITEGFLRDVAEVVDIVEPVVSFTDQIKDKPGVGEIYNIGLEDWHPDRDGLGPYDLIWNQWCVGQLNDKQFVEYLQRLPKVLSEGGLIIVKENLSNSGEDVYDETDSSVTRTDEKFRLLFEEAGLKLVRTELQKGMVEGLYPVRCYGLQPK